MQKPGTLALALSLALALGVSAAAHAQGAPDSAQGMTGAPQYQAQAVEFSEADLQKFADVQSELDMIRQDYSARLSTVEDQQRAAQLQEEAVQVMTTAVQETGLPVETYNQIAIALQTDEALRSKLESMMN